MSSVTRFNSRKLLKKRVKDDEAKVEVKAGRTKSKTDRQTPKGFKLGRRKKEKGSKYATPSVGD